MRTNKFRGLIIAAIVFPALSLAARASDDFKKDLEDANRLYDQAKYSQAESLYNSIVLAGHYSPELFYNLGNTEFRLDKTGAAILSYERALTLSPNNPEIQANLAYSRAQTGARIAGRDWSDNILMNFDVNSYCLLAAIAAWIGIFALGGLLLKSRSHATSLTLIAVCCAATAGYAVFAIRHLEKNDALAVVMEKDAQARFAPADNSTLAAALPVGTRVWILERRGPWVYCRLPDDNQAWIPAGDIERVRLQNS